MKNYHALVSPPSAPPMPAGPDGGVVAGSLVEELDPSINVMIGKRRYSRLLRLEANALLACPYLSLANRN